MTEAEFLRDLLQWAIGLQRRLKAELAALASASPVILTRLTCNVFL